LLVTSYKQYFILFFLEFFGGEKNCKLAVEDWIKFKAHGSAMETNMLE